MVSKVIKGFEKFFLKKNYVFTHVGLAIKTELIVDIIPCTNLKKSKYLVFESTLSGSLNDNVRDVCDNIYLGVQLRSFDELVKEYKAKKSNMIAYSKISNLPNNYKEVIRRSITKYINKGYDLLSMNLLLIHVPISGIKTDNMFCSELVCKILKDLNLVSSNVKEKKVSPNTIFNICSDICTPVYIVY